MKKLIVLMIVALVPAFLPAQNTPLSELYDRYDGKPGFKSIEIFPGSMNILWEKTKEGGTIREMMQNIESIRILKYKTDTEGNKQEKIWKKIQRVAGDVQYMEVATVNAERIEVHLYMIKGPAGNTREFAILEKDENGIMMATATGEMDFSAMFSAENMQNLREMAAYYIHNKEDCKPE